MLYRGISKVYENTITSRTNKRLFSTGITAAIDLNLGVKSPSILRGERLTENPPYDHKVKPYGNNRRKTPLTTMHSLFIDLVKPAKMIHQRTYAYRYRL